MRNLGVVFLLSLCAALSACSKTAEPVTTSYSQAQIEEAKVIAVLSYAQWCASCKILTPKINKLRADYEAKGMVFVSLDFTDKDISAFYAEAAKDGVEAPVRNYFNGGIITGRLMLLSPEGEMLTRPVNMNHTPDEIRARFDKALAKAG